jgi:DNA-binding CsgD family transcriptional regulator
MTAVDSTSGPQARLDGLLPGWIESSTAHRLLRDTDSADEVEARVRAAWDDGDLRCENGLWWMPPPLGADRSGAVAVPSEVEDAAQQMRERCDEGRPEQALLIGYQVGASLMGRLASEPAVEGGLAQIAITSVLALTEAGRLHAAEPIARSGHRESVARGVPHGQAWFAAALGIVELIAGHTLDSRRHFAEAHILGRVVHDRVLEQFGGEGWALTYTMVGQRPPAIVEPARASDTELEGLDEVSRLEHAARRAAWSGNDPRLEQLERVAIGAKRAGRYGRAATLAGELALLGNPVAACAIFRRFGELDGELLPLWPRIAEALAAGDDAALADIAAVLDRLGIMGMSAALTLQSAAFAQHRDPERTRALLREANRRASGIQLGSEYLAQFRRLLPLRDREHQIAELASRGLTNKQIAEKLVLSIRTVENHLYRVYDKLGIAGRDELVELFSAHHP